MATSKSQRPQTTAATPSDKASSQRRAPVTNSEGEKVYDRRDYRLDYPVPEDGLTEVPRPWESSKYKPLRKSQFADEVCYHEWRAEFYEAQAKEHREQAEALKKLGSPEERKAASKIISAVTQIEKLKAELEGSGIDVEKMIESLKK